MLDTILDKLLEQQELAIHEAEEAMEAICQGVHPCQTAAFLSILKYRGERPQELAGMLQALQKKAVAVQCPFPVLDIVGTGGDRAHTVNISTGSAILAAACGIPVAKHGNRSVSSRCGSADVLEELGICLDMSPTQLIECIESVGIGFMFAPLYHPILKELGTIRKALKIPTIFNLLGPLLNPAQAEYGLIGVAHEHLMDLMAQTILLMENKKRTLIFHGHGLDELTSLGKIKAYEVLSHQIRPIDIDPLHFGLQPCSIEDLKGGYAADNAQLLKETFKGKPGAIADALILNTGYAIWIYGQASCPQEGIEIAKQALKEGKAMERLNQWIAFSQKIKAQEALK